MPKGPQGQKRRRDVVSNAVKVMRIATGEEEEVFYALHYHKRLHDGIGKSELVGAFTTFPYKNLATIDSNKFLQVLLESGYLHLPAQDGRYRRANCPANTERGRSSVVEHHVANVRVVSSNLIARSKPRKTCWPYRAGHKGLPLHRRC